MVLALGPQAVQALVVTVKHAHSPRSSAGACAQRPSARVGVPHALVHMPVHNIRPMSRAKQLICANA